MYVLFRFQSYVRGYDAAEYACLHYVDMSTERSCQEVIEALEHNVYRGAIFKKHYKSTRQVKPFLKSRDPKPVRQQQH